MGGAPARLCAAHGRAAWPQPQPASLECTCVPAHRPRCRARHPGLDKAVAPAAAWGWCRANSVQAAACILGDARKRWSCLRLPRRGVQLSCQLAAAQRQQQARCSHRAVAARHPRPPWRASAGPDWTAPQAAATAWLPGDRVRASEYQKITRTCATPAGGQGYRADCDHAISEPPVPASSDGTRMDEAL